MVAVRSRYFCMCFAAVFYLMRIVLSVNVFGNQTAPTKSVSTAVSMQQSDHKASLPCTCHGSLVFCLFTRCSS